MACVSEHPHFQVRVHVAYIVHKASQLCPRYPALLLAMNIMGSGQHDMVIFALIDHVCSAGGPMITSLTKYGEHRASEEGGLWVP